MYSPPIQFSGTVVPGSARGKDIGFPTMNIEFDAVPEGLQEGIHACYARIENAWLPAVMHFGGRPVFNDTPSCEIHILDRTDIHAPKELEVQLIGFIRSVENFPSVEALVKQIEQDIAHSRGMLKRYEHEQD